MFRQKRYSKLILKLIQPNRLSTHYTYRLTENDIRISRIYDNKGNENVLGLTKKAKHDR